MREQMKETQAWLDNNKKLKQKGYFSSVSPPPSKAKEDKTPEAGTDFFQELIDADKAKVHMKTVESFNQYRKATNQLS